MRLDRVGCRRRSNRACAGSRNRWRVLRCRCLCHWNRLGELDGCVLDPVIMRHRVNMPSFLRKQRWTRLEVAVWLFALAFVAISGILLATQAVGHWVLPVGGVIAASLGL